MNADFEPTPLPAVFRLHDWRMLSAGRECRRCLLLQLVGQFDNVGPCPVIPVEEPTFLRVSRQDEPAGVA